MEFAIDTVLDIGSDEFYRVDRYHIPMSVVLLNSKDSNLFNIIEKSLRRTDMIQQLTSELIVVFLPHTTYDGATVYINKLDDSVEFTCTVGEYKESRVKFVKDLFLQNNKKI